MGLLYLVICHISYFTFLINILNSVAVSMLLIIPLQIAPILLLLYNLYLYNLFKVAYELIWPQSTNLSSLAVMSTVSVSYHMFCFWTPCRKDKSAKKIYGPNHACSVDIFNFISFIPILTFPCISPSQLPFYFSIRNLTKCSVFEHTVEKRKLRRKYMAQIMPAVLIFSILYPSFLYLLSLASLLLNFLLISPDEIKKSYRRTVGQIKRKMAKIQIIRLPRNA
jgi:hypothetical protein